MPSLMDATLLHELPIAVADCEPDHPALTLGRERLPLYMLRAKIDIRDGKLARNANGKMDRKLLVGEFQRLLEKA